MRYYTKLHASRKTNSLKIDTFGRLSINPERFIQGVERIDILTTETSAVYVERKAFPFIELMSGYNPETYVSNRAIEAQSVARISNLLIAQFHFCGVEETEHFDSDDKKGIDLFAFPDKEFTALTDFPMMAIQVKSSEIGLEGFYEKGKRINGREGYEWRKMRLVVLNGSWAQETVLADFIGQTTNLMGIWGDSEKISAFVGQLDEYPQQCFSRTMAKGLLEQYRGALYDWVAGKKRPIRPRQSVSSKRAC